MKKGVNGLFLALLVVAGFQNSPVFADLGLQKISTEQGASAVGQAVYAAAKTAFVGKDATVVKNQLIAILNEAAATGNEASIRYAIIAVMLAGGSENLALSRDAINNSNIFSGYQTLTATTVAETEALMKAAGGSGVNGGDNQLGGSGQNGGAIAGGDKALGGGDDKTLGGGNGNPFLMGAEDSDNPFKRGSSSSDNDLPATRT